MAPFFEFSRLPIDKRWLGGFWHPEARSHRRSKTFVARSFVRPSCYRRRRSFNVKPSFCANLKPTIICHTQCQPEGNSMTVGIEKCPINSNLIQMLPKNFKSVLVKIENIRRSICNRPSSNNMIQALTLVMVIASHNREITKKVDSATFFEGEWLRAPYFIGTWRKRGLYSGLIYVERKPQEWVGSLSNGPILNQSLALADSWLGAHFF